MNARLRTALAIGLLLTFTAGAAKDQAPKLTDLPKTDDGAYILFNGKDLTGWDGDPRFWSVEDGAITGRTMADPKLTSNTFLIFRGGNVRDFELRLKWRMDNGNSGVQFRSRQLPARGDNKWVVGGYQADIADNQYLGILYEEQGPRGIAAQVGERVTLLPDKKKNVEKIGDAAQIKAGVNHKDWNEYVITAKGNHITQKLNGKTTVEVIDEDEKNRAMEGILALQIHVGPPMKVQFRDITLKMLDDGK
jgi:hypothetical protein